MKKQHYFQALNYTLGDEDSIVEYEILPENVNHLVAIAGSGGRVVPLLAKGPGQLTCIDILDEQLYITELRIQAIRKFDFNTYRSFLGYPPNIMRPEERKAAFEQLDLSSNARSYLEKLLTKYKWSEIIYLGKFEKTMATLSKINSLIVGKKGRDMFLCKNLEEQRIYCKEKFPHSRWRKVLFLLGNATVLNSLLYKGDFPKKNIEGSYYDNFKNIYYSIFNNIWINSSFFAHLSFYGKIVNDNGNPIEVWEDVFLKAKENLQHCKVSYVKDSIIDFIAKSPPRSIDFVSLSDVPSFMQEHEDDYLQLIKPALADNSMVVVRGNLRITRPETTGMINIKDNYADVLLKETTQLWKTDIYSPALQ